MALASTTVWEVRTGGSDNSGGGYNPSRSGSSTDRSLSDTAYKNGTNLTVDATTNTDVAPDGYTPDATADPGNLIQITAGAGFTAGFYEIVSIQSGKWRLDRSPAATGTSGGTWAMGGALASPGKAAGAKIAGNTIYIKAGTYTITTTSSNVAAGIVNDTLAGFWEGYQTTRGDFGTKPLLQVASSGVTSVTLFSTSARVTNLALDGLSKTSIRGWALNSGVVGYRLKASNCTNRAYSGGGNAMGCEATGCSSAPAFVGVCCWACEAHDNTVTGFSFSNAGQWLVSCLSYNNSGATTDGFAGSPGFLVNCVAYANGRDQFHDNGGSGTAPSTYINCLAQSTSGWGWNAESTADPNIVLINCAGYCTGSGTVNTTFITGRNLNFQTLTASPFTNPTGNDFSLNATPGGGALCRAAGYPGIFPRATTTGYLDIGACQSHPPPFGAPGLA
jgi:hypothetical protein